MAMLNNQRVYPVKKYTTDDWLIGIPLNTIILNLNWIKMNKDEYPVDINQQGVWADSFRQWPTKISMLYAKCLGCTLW